MLVSQKRHRFTAHPRLLHKLGDRTRNPWSRVQSLPLSATCHKLPSSITIWITKYLTFWILYINPYNSNFKFFRDIYSIVFYIIVQWVLCNKCSYMDIVSISGCNPRIKMPIKYGYYGKILPMLGNWIYEKIFLQSGYIDPAKYS